MRAPTRVGTLSSSAVELKPIFWAKAEKAWSVGARSVPLNIGVASASVRFAALISRASTVRSAVPLTALVMVWVAPASRSGSMTKSMTWRTPAPIRMSLVTIWRVTG
jgi:hypothetical protein